MLSGCGAAVPEIETWTVPFEPAAPVVTMWNVVPPTADTRRWASHIAGSNPSNAFVIIMPANE